jgi:hypothetical protein
MYLLGRKERGAATKKKAAFEVICRGQKTSKAGEKIKSRRKDKKNPI